MSGRGVYRKTTGHSTAVVGIGLHSVNEIEEEVRSLHTEMMSFGDELLTQLFGSDPRNRTFNIPKVGVSQEKIDLYQKIWRPLMSEWLSFRDVHKDSLWQNLPFSGAWDKTQEFRQRLIGVREAAKKERFKLIGPEPIAPKQDLDLTKTIASVLKVAGYAAVGVGGLFVLRMVWLLRKSTPKDVGESRHDQDLE